MSCFLPDQTIISQVHLRTANLARALAFYSRVLGLKVVEQTGPNAALSATGKAPAFIILTEDPDAQLRPQRALGLYHFALRYPTRRDLAEAYVRLVNHDWPIEGASDHGVSEAIYLADADDNGVELYADRPRSQWRIVNGQVGMTTRGIDLDGLLSEVGDSRAKVNQREMPSQTELGHIHLHVGDLPAAERFYHEYLGLAVTQRSYPGALFFAAGGYHHHIGVNTWAGRDAAPPDAVGLISYRLKVPEAELLYCLGHRAPLLGYESRIEAAESGSEILRIRDPNGVWLELESTAPMQEGPDANGGLGEASLSNAQNCPTGRDALRGENARRQAKERRDKISVQKQAVGSLID